MKQIFNNAYLKQKRRTLRNNQTSHEAFLWSKLRNRKLNGYKFIRQYSVDNYILDFYCPAEKLAVELDGSQHFTDKDQVEHDRERGNFLKNNNIKIIRFINYQVRYDIDKVLGKIIRALES